MSVTLTLGTGSLKRRTLSATANICEQVDLPYGTRWIMVKSVGAAQPKIAYNGTDGATIDANNIAISSNTLVYIPTCGHNSIYLASATASAVVAIMAIGGALGDIG